jgi:hypothetical protein
MRAKATTKLERAVRREDARDAIVALRAEKRRHDLEVARHFYEVDRDLHWIHESCSSIRQFGEKYGFSEREAEVLAGVGKALALAPEMEEKLLAGRITLDAAAAVATILGGPDLLKDGDDWLAEAEVLTLPALQRKVRERIVEIREREPASTVTATMPASGREKFERARVIASRKKRKALSEGETVVVLADHYLDSFDEMRKRLRARRMADTNGGPGGPGSRAVPATEKRKVRMRGEECQFPGCSHRIFVDLAHRRPHAAGGSRESDNLLALCRTHPALFDAGWIRAEGPSDRPEFFERVMTEFGRGWMRVETIRAPPG